MIGTRNRYMGPGNHTALDFFYRTVRQVALAGEGPDPAPPRPGPSKPSPAGNEASAPGALTGAAKAAASDFSASKSSNGVSTDIHTTRNNRQSVVSNEEQINFHN